MTPRRAATFRLDDALLEALHAVKARDGIPVNEQVRRAVLLWLESKGVKPAPRRAPTRRRT